ncbi:ANTAR domain protein [Actinobacteria bacterium OK074]|nr:ANTAR domain protein [Actinobacteria bacterium OK074]
MRHLTTPGEERPLLTAVAPPAYPDLLAEVVELRASNEQLVQALDSRAVIDQARGMVMALAPCSSQRAWDLLVDVSQRNNIKLREVATALVATTEHEALPEPIRRELSRALRRMQVADGGR